MADKKLARPILLYAASDPNILYRTGFWAPDPVVAIDEGDRVTLWVDKREIGPANEQKKPGVRVRDTAAARDIAKSLPPGDKPTNFYSREIAAICKLQGISAVTVNHDFPALQLDELRQLGIDVEVGSGVYDNLRRQKSEAEIEEVARAQKAGLDAMDQAISVIRRSKIRGRQLYFEGEKLTGEYLVNLIERRLFDLGYSTEEGTIACGAPANQSPHTMTSSYLRAGYPIILDIFPRNKKSRMWGDMTRTVVRGKPQPGVEEMYTAVLDAQQTALAMARPGVTGGEIHEAVCETLKKYGYGSDYANDNFVDIASTIRFKHGTGHGVGLDIHEAPYVGGNARQPLLPGDVITIEPGVYGPKLGGVRIEDTIVITEDGYRQLTPYPKEFRVEGTQSPPATELSA
jgi:Xaa-Pro aminopeptidase